MQMLPALNFPVLLSSVLALLLGGSSCLVHGQTLTVAAAQVEVKRHILCIYGTDPSDPTRTPVWAADTFTSQMLQMTLEWQGYVVDYHDVARALPPEQLPDRYAGVILDSQLELPDAQEEWYAKWLIHHRQRDLRLLFIGSYGFDRKDSRLAMLDALGVRGSLDDVIAGKDAKFAALDKSVVDASLLTVPRVSGLIVAQAPPEAKRALSVSCVDARNLQVMSDAIYSAPWGGALLEPYLFFRTSGEDVRLVMDPFVFLSRVFPETTWPIPDTTTRDGLRIFMSHIDGDGFTTLSRTQRNVTCAEVVRDQVLKVYPFPVSVSVIEADTRAMLLDQNPGDRHHYEEVARSIFALPHIQGASHSFSHPFVWIPEDKESLRGYDTINLHLADAAAYPAIQLEREIQGSVDYIQKELMPQGKKMELFLWSGNCRPSGVALSMVEKLGLEAMNGGNTMISRRAQGIASISPVDTFMDGVLQIYAPVQNEYVYTGGFNGPLYGGYRLVIDTLQITETPRRLKPVCLYYHFYIAQTGDSLQSLKVVHDWCAKQPLHSMTGKQFVQIAKDARSSEIHRIGPQRWSFTSQGHCRTLRVPERWGAPHLAKCEGVTGYHTHQGQTYLHTTGAKKVVVDFNKSSAPTLPWLVTSTGEIIVQERTASSFTARVTDLRPVQVLVGGLSAKAKYSVQGELLGGKPLPPKKLEVDKSGRVSLTVPAVCTFTILRES